MALLGLLPSNNDQSPPETTVSVFRHQLRTEQAADGDLAIWDLERLDTPTFSVLKAHHAIVSFLHAQGTTSRPSQINGIDGIGGSVGLRRESLTRHLLQSWNRRRCARDRYGFTRRMRSSVGSSRARRSGTLGEILCVSLCSGDIVGFSRVSAHSLCTRTLRSAILTPKAC